jgi:uncharacterized protein with GYD domain
MQINITKRVTAPCVMQENIIGVNKSANTTKHLIALFVVLVNITNKQAKKIAKTVLVANTWRTRVNKLGNTTKQEIALFVMLVNITKKQAKKIAKCVNMDNIKTSNIKRGAKIVREDIITKTTKTMSMNTTIQTIVKDAT